MLPRLARVRSFVEGRRVVVWAALLGVLVTLPSVGLGLSFDDFWHRIYLLREGRWATAAKGVLDLFVFYDGDPARTHRLMDAGVAPWWTDPTIRIAFLRPLSALTHALDYRLWPSAPVLMHLHSIAWYAVLVAVAAALYRRLFASKLAAGIAALCFAVDYAHGLPAAWVANRNAVIAATFGLVALLLHDRARRGASRSSKWLAPLSLLVGLFAGESAAGALGYLVAYAVFFDGAAGNDRATRLSLRARLASLWPHAPVVALWAVVYRIGGYGVRGSGMYLDPGRDPVGYLRAVAAHLPVLLAADLGAPVADFYGVVPRSAQLVLVAIAALFVGVALVALAPLLRRSPLAQFLAAGAVLSLLPPCATAPSLRLLLLPSFGLLGLVAALAVALLEDAPWAASAPLRRMRAAFAVYLAVGHLAIAPLAIQLPERQMSMVDALAGELAAGIPENARARVVVVNAPDALLTAYLGVRREMHGATAPDAMLALAIGTRPVAIERRDARTLVVRSEGGFYRSMTDVLTRSTRAPMPVGTTVRLAGVSIAVTHAGADGVPDEAAFAFDAPLEDPGLVFLRWSGRDLVPFELPAVGATTHIAPQTISL